MIAFSQVEKRIKGKPIIKGVTFEIKKGDAVGIVGPNGAGKSTLLKLMATVIKPEAGSVYYNAIPYHKCIRPLRQQIGYIPQDIALFEELTVKDQISFWKKATKNKASKNYIKQMIESLSLYSVYNQKVKALSGGWKRKLNVCAGMLHDPDIILLDEPTVGVDLAAKDDLLNWLKALRSLGKTIVLISHDWDVIQRLCDDILILKEGNLLFKDSFSKLDLFEQHLSLEHDQELIKILKQRIHRLPS